MSDKKYELRSSEVQEIMIKAPHLFISWGNMVVIGVVVSAICLLNRLTLDKRIPMAITVVGVNVRAGEPGPALALALNTPLPRGVKVIRQARLQLSDRRPGHLLLLTGSIDSIGSNPFGAPVIRFRSTGPYRPVGLGMIGSLEVVAEKRTLVSMFLDRLNIGENKNNRH